MNTRLPPSPASELLRADKNADPSARKSSAAARRLPLVCVRILLHLLKEVRVNEEDQTPVLGAALLNPPSAFINEHGGGNNASILTTTDALDSIWKTVPIEEHTCLSDEECKWLALCQAIRGGAFVDPSCQEDVVAKFNSMAVSEIRAIGWTRTQ
ncbi:unnamed protein product [Vitrella brassicaformis CCMP3155]|uniref:Uncharacterized protein n=1 Tax=Vitrella brassicaformis (strain CCMP3155) TaxID=1169540 RepID=A0A0G4G6B4_VITBC|nr:unnamed protein product [Vitrella brassicaformis CCMP3155]|eukprot:CEM24103.1 unnamed protein product [Vitrella brassicaformis CCMP3155]